jgi:hypothetical protein
MRNTRPWFGKAVATLLLLSLTALMPSRGGRRIGHPKAAAQIRQLGEQEAASWMEGRGAGSTRRDAALAQLNRAGFSVGQTVVFEEEERRPGSFWERLFTASAEDFYASGAYLSVTVLDDGDYNTIEYYVWGVTDLGDEIWGCLQALAENPSNVWTWGEGLYEGSAANLGSPFGEFGEMLSPTVSAYNCMGGWGAAREILQDGFVGAVAGYLGSATCLLSGLGPHTPVCIIITVGAGFAAGIGGGLWGWHRQCQDAPA